MYNARFREEIRENKMIKREIDARIVSSKGTNWVMSHAPSQETLNDDARGLSEGNDSVVGFSSPALEVSTDFSGTEYANGVVYEYFQGNFDLLPDFDTLVPYSVGVQPDFKLDATSERAFIRAAFAKAGNAPNSPSKASVTSIHSRSTTALSTLTSSNSAPRSILDFGNFAARFMGWLNVPQSGTWTFNISSNDGSALYIAGKQLINNDGAHYNLEKSASLFLEEGRHPVSVLYFHKNGKLLEGLRTGAQLQVSMSCRECEEYAEKKLVPEYLLWHEVSQANLSASLATGNESAFSLVPIQSSPAKEPRSKQLLRAFNDSKTYYEGELAKLQGKLNAERERTAKLVNALQSLAIFSNLPDDAQNVDHYVESLIELVLHDVDRLKQLYFISTGLSIKMANQKQEEARLANADSLKEPSQSFLKKLFSRQPKGAAVAKPSHVAVKQSNSVMATKPLGRAYKNVDLHDLYEDVQRHQVPVEDWGKVLNQVFILAIMTRELDEI